MQRTCSANRLRSQKFAFDSAVVLLLTSSPRFSRPLSLRDSHRVRRHSSQDPLASEPRVSPPLNHVTPRVGSKTPYLPFRLRPLRPTTTELRDGLPRSG